MAHAQQVIAAFGKNEARKVRNLRTDGVSLFLYDHTIARWDINHELWVTDAGWPTTTTRRNLNHIPNVTVTSKGNVWSLNGKVWDGKWAKINDWDET